MNSDGASTIKKMTNFGGVEHFRKNCKKVSVETPGTDEIGSKSLIAYLVIFKKIRGLKKFAKY